MCQQLLPLFAVCLFAAGCGGEDEKGLTTTASGLKYKDLTEGDGEPAKAGDWVEVNYTGTLRADGTIFDSNLGKNPYAFKLGLGRVIRGWDEGVAGIKPGGKRKLIIPPDLAYGATGSGNKIPPNADLVFEVELLRIVPRVSELTKDDMELGTGEAVKDGTVVEVYYTGKLIAGGTVFDSNIGKEPIEVQVGAGKVIKGWDEGLLGMKTGGKRRLLIPAKLGYGMRGSPDGRSVPPDADLDFEVWLFRIR